MKISSQKKTPDGGGFGSMGKSLLPLPLQIVQKSWKFWDKDKTDKTIPQSATWDK